MIGKTFAYLLSAVLAWPVPGGATRRVRGKEVICDGVRRWKN